MTSFKSNSYEIKIHRLKIPLVHTQPFANCCVCHSTDCCILPWHCTAYSVPRHSQGYFYLEACIPLVNGLPWWLRWLSICLQCRRPRFNTIPGLGRPPGEGNGNPLQYSCLQNPMDGGAWEATIHGVAKSRTQLSDFTFFSFFLYPSSKVLYVCFVGMEVGKLLVNHPSWFSSPDAFF